MKTVEDILAEAGYVPVGEFNQESDVCMVQVVSKSRPNGRPKTVVVSRKEGATIGSQG